jgi:hypothetical protein
LTTAYNTKSFISLTNKSVDFRDMTALTCICTDQMLKFNFIGPFPSTSSLHQQLISVRCAMLQVEKSDSGKAMDACYAAVLVGCLCLRSVALVALTEEGSCGTPSSNLPFT